jgi:hypothetical protein
MSWWNWYKFICEVVPKHDGGKLGTKMHGYYWEEFKMQHNFFFSRIAMYSPIFQLGPSLSLRKLEAYNCMIWLLLPLQACYV